jgi:hypothetical protein
MSNKVISLRDIDRKRLNGLQERTTTALSHEDIWYIHTVLAQCFLPYRDPKNRDWTRRNGDFSIALMAGHVEDSRAESGMRIVGLPYGAKPRLFQSYVCTQAIKQQSPVIPVERSMTGMMQELGLKVGGGKNGTIRGFKDQITRFAACKFTIIGPGPRGSRRHIHAEPFRSFDVWFPSDPAQGTLWPSEIVLTDDYYYSLKDHAVPYDFRALREIQNKPRAQDIYLWMTQRLCRIDEKKPLFMPWQDLYEMFGGQSALKEFKRKFPKDLKAAWTSYPSAHIEEEADGFRFRYSPPPIPKTKIFLGPPGKE